MVGISKYYLSDNHYMYNNKTRRIIIRDIKWEPFIRSSFIECLDEVLRPDENREMQKEIARQSDEDKYEDENNPEEDMNHGGQHIRDDIEVDVEEIIHPQVKGSKIRYQLK